MADLTGAVSVLGVSGTPQAPASQYSIRTGESAVRTYTGAFTELAFFGVSGAVHGPYSGRTGATSDGKVVTDRYVPVLTFGDVAAVDIDLLDVYVPVLGMSARIGQSRTVGDVYRPVMGMAITNLVKSGTLAKSAADSYVPVLTMTSAARAQLAGTDSYVPVLTMVATSVSTSDEVVLTDSYVPVLDFGTNLQVIAGTQARAVSDSYVATLGMAVAVNQGGDVDAITIYTRPYGRITLVRV
jgi:hypothetical protein